jgi:NitT/TauT family transport system permease protein
LDPLLTAHYSVAIVALAQLFIAWLGLGLESKIAIVVLVAIFPVIINTGVGLRSADAMYVDASRPFTASRAQIFATVTLPFAIPFIIGGAHVAFTPGPGRRHRRGVLRRPAGYGHAIMAVGRAFNTAQLLGYVVLLGMLSSIGLRAWERRLAPWRDDA